MQNLTTILYVEWNFSLTKEDIGVVLDEVGLPECLNAKQVGKVMKHTFRNWNQNEYVRMLEKLSLPDNKPFGEFSRGMRMKLGIAVAMSHGAKLLLLDEPAAGMNPHETEDLAKTIRFIRDHFDMTILLIEHDMNFVSDLCDELTVLSFGTVLSQGKTKDVLQDPKVIKAYIGG